MSNTSAILRQRSDVHHLTVPVESFHHSLVYETLPWKAIRYIMLGDDVSRGGLLLLGLPWIHAHVYANKCRVGQIHHRRGVHGWPCRIFHQRRVQHLDRFHPVWASVAYPVAASITEKAEMVAYPAFWYWTHVCVPEISLGSFATSIDFNPVVVSLALRGFEVYITFRFQRITHVSLI